MIEAKSPITVENFEPHIGAEAVERIMRKAARVNDLHVVNVNSTYYGGGVAELLEELVKGNVVNRIEVEPETKAQAFVALQRMLDVTAQRTQAWDKA